LHASATRAEEAPGVRRSVPEDLRVYAIGDIHGRLDLLEALHEAIRGDARDHGGARRLLVYLGDYVDRGPASRQVIDLLIAQPLEGFEAVHLLGNHEFFLRRFLTDPGVGDVWLMNGGETTLQSYGIEPWDDPPADSERLPWLSRRLDAALPAAHRRFLEGLRHSHAVGDYLFVHAGIRPGVPLDRQEPEDLIWIREPFLGSQQEFGKLVVHGHTPDVAPVRRSNRICVDTGACYGGRLTALVLQGDEQTFLQA
jgi:serine/threonine protein phosphatase 1